MVKIGARFVSAAARVATVSAITTLLLTTTMAASEAWTSHHRSHHAGRRHHHHRHVRHLLPVSPDAPSSDLMFDAANGRVLAVANPDQRVYPASLTKMMTLYLAFRSMDRGWVSSDDVMHVSAYAAAASPTKLGLRSGQDVRVDDLMLGAITESANDAARALAENLDRDQGANLLAMLRADLTVAQARDAADAANDPPSPAEAADAAQRNAELNALVASIHPDGSEADFARIMTLQARLLGMDDTTFRNATGLPDPEQQTTAPDMAVLAYAVVHLPANYYAYFSTRQFKFAGRDHRNHNLQFLTGYDGADGIKTGYTEGGGFNVADSAQRDGRRLIAVVMGRRSHAGRDADVRAMLDAGFANPAIEAATGATDDDLVIGSTLDLPDLANVSRQTALQPATSPASSPVRAAEPGGHSAALR